MQFKNARWAVLAALILVGLLVSATAIASDPGGGAVPTAGIDADTVDGHHAGPSDGGKAQRANRVLWASKKGRFSKKALPMGVLDDRYLTTFQDTLIYVPGSLLVMHWDDVSKATVRVNNTGQAVIEPLATGWVDAVVPIPLEAQQNGRWVKLVNMRVYYDLDDASSYIDHTWIRKINDTGGHHNIGESSGDRTSTSWTSYVVDCSDPGCQLSWPTGGFITVGFGFTFGGTGADHEIRISGVLMRVSYDG